MRESKPPRRMEPGGSVWARVHQAPAQMNPMTPFMDPVSALQGPGMDQNLKENDPETHYMDRLENISLGLEDKPVTSKNTYWQKIHADHNLGRLAEEDKANYESLKARMRDATWGMGDRAPRKDD